MASVIEYSAVMHSLLTGLSPYLRSRKNNDAVIPSQIQPWTMPF